MTSALANRSDLLNTRRWPRYHVSLPILISTESDFSKIAVPGLACEISQGGMALYGGVALEPGELMEVEFQTSGKLRIEGIIRNRSGFCFGLEFLDFASGSEAISNVLHPVSTVESHPSWKTWVATHRGDAFIAIAAILLLLAFSAGGSPSAQSRVAQAKPSLTVSERVLVALGLAELPPAPIVAGNPNAQVWVDLHTALYYCAGSDLFGKTPDGKFTTQRDAQLDQFEPAARKNCE
jgi:hypothetical protein